MNTTVWLLVLIFNAASAPTVQIYGTYYEESHCNYRATDFNGQGHETRKAVCVKYQP